MPLSPRTNLDEVIVLMSSYPWLCLAPPTPHDGHDRCRSLDLWYKQVDQANAERVITSCRTRFRDCRRSDRTSKETRTHNPYLLTAPAHTTIERQQHSEKVGTSTPRPARGTLRGKRTHNHDGSFWPHHGWPKTDALSTARPRNQPWSF